MTDNIERARVLRAALTAQERSDIIDALEYEAEDLSYRMGNGVDFEPEDMPELHAGLKRSRALVALLRGEE